MTERAVESRHRRKSRSRSRDARIRPTDEDDSLDADAHTHDSAKMRPDAEAVARDEPSQRGSSTRRTQAERTAETTERILQATVMCLADVGHARTSTTEICRRAGVSRGALLHHYRTKDELLAAAVTHVFERSVAEFRTRLTTLPDEADRVGEAVDALWDIFRSDTFDAWLELIVAGRTDVELRRHVAHETEVLTSAVDEAWNDLFPETAMREEFAAAPLLLFSLLEGLALNRHTGSTVIEDALPLVIAHIKAMGVLQLADSNPRT